MSKETVVTDRVTALWELYAEDPSEENRNRLVLHYSSLVTGIVRSMLGHSYAGAHAEDAVNEGLIALINAVERFRSEKMVKFETYASIRVRGAVLDYLRRLDPFPRRLRSMAKLLQRTAGDFFQKNGRTPTDDELAAAMNLGEEEYRKLLAETASLNVLSFEELLYEQNAETPGGDESETGNPQESLEQTEFRDLLARAVDGLPAQERTVVSLYYKNGLKIKEIAEILGVGSSRVSQIHSAALVRLRAAMEAYLNRD